MCNEANLSLSLTEQCKWCWVFPVAWTSIKGGKEKVKQKPTKTKDRQHVLAQHSVAGVVKYLVEERIAGCFTHGN